MVIPWRVISKNFALSQEITQNLGHKTFGGNVIIKIDMEKAFDKVNNAYLFKVLSVFRFNEEWIKMLKVCLCNNYFSVSYEGKSFGNFKSPKELRQEDPISSLLFILSEETLSKGLHAHLNGLLTLYKGPKACPMVFHLLYVDDCLIITNESKINLKKLINFLERYAKCLG